MNRAMPITATNYLRKAWPYLENTCLEYEDRLTRAPHLYTEREQYFWGGYRTFLESAPRAPKFIVPFLTTDRTDDVRDAVLALGAAEGFRLPFPEILIEEQDSALMVFATQVGDDILIRVFGAALTGWAQLRQWALLRKNGTVDTADIIDDLDSERVRGTTYRAAALAVDMLCALRCANVRTEKLIARPLNNACKRRGVLPFDDYHVLVVDSVDNDGEPLSGGTGGAHRSPREHIRRGTWCTSKKGKRFWRNTSTVNKGSSGRITKDYMVKQ